MEESKNENPKLKIRKSLRKSIVLMDDFKSSVSSDESQDDDLYSEFSFDYDDNAEEISKGEESSHSMKDSEEKENLETEARPKLENK